jgi:curved DNA-binding protein CbpA
MINRKVGLYGVLGVDAGASADEIKAAYWRRAKNAYPDAGGSAQEFGDVKLAHTVLSDPERRARYDRAGEVEEPSPCAVAPCRLAAKPARKYTAPKRDQWERGATFMGSGLQPFCPPRRLDNGRTWWCPSRC